MEYTRFFNLFAGLGVTVGVWLAGLTGLFFYPNGYIYDFLLRSAPPADNPSAVLLILADRQAGESGDDVWQQTLTTLREMGARQILFSFMPANASRAFYETAAKRSDVLFGRRRLSGVEDWDVTKFEAIPPQAEGLDLRLGPMAIPESNHGINRSEQTAWSIGRRENESLVVTAYRERAGDIRDLGRRFLINFSGRPGGIPKADLSGVLKRTLVSEVVQGKSVLVGFRIPDGFAGVRTPVNPDRPDMTPVEYHGFALDTLLSGRIIDQFGRMQSIMVIGLFTALGLFVHTLLAPRPAIAVVLSLIVSVLIGGGVLLLSLRLWIPVVEVIAALTAVLVVTAWHRTSERNLKAQDFIMEKSARVMFGSVPESIVDSQDHWNQLVHMVNQTLPLEKTIFLEKVPDDHRVKEVVALNTSLSDIMERRRDYERTPYSIALERGVPVKVDRFFKSVSAEEEQFIVPLSFGGTILGFWAFTVKSDQVGDVEKLSPMISMFSAQFAELLYRRSEWGEFKEAEQGGLRRILGLKKSPDVIDRMVNLVAFLELRLALLESALEASGSASMLCDLFGRVLAVNKNMKDLCDRMGVAPYQLTALDILVRLTGKTPTETRTIINRSILESGTINLPVAVSSNGIESFFLMTVSALKSQATHRLHSVDQERYPFDLYGLLIEMMEVSERADVTRVKDRILEQGSIRIQEGLETLVNLIAILEKHVPATLAGSVLEQIRFSRSSLSAAIDELRSYLDEEGFSPTMDYYPVDAAEPVSAAVMSLQKEAEKRGLAFEVDGPSGQVLVQAMPQELAELIEAVLGILVDDAYKDTRILVRIVPNGLEAAYELTNDGYGMPDEDFQRYLQSPETAESEQFETIGRLRGALALWGAELTGSSEVGVGTHFRLRLNRSLLSQ